MGLSTIYLASALDEGEPPMISTELEPAKVAAARSHVAEAGLAHRVTILEGDALTTLADIDGPVSFVFLDGWKSLYLPVLRMLEPALVEGALIVADDTTQPMLRHLSVDYLAYVRDASNGYVSAELPIDDGIEISRRERP